jgi:sigma-B regulation protein RsbU (phosphoserine phosphatase)
MAVDIAGSLLLLIQLSCVIVVVAYLLTRRKFFLEVLDGHPSVRTQLILIAVFGALSIYGTVGGVEILGGIINVRDLGPMVAGLLGGPVVGVATGVIGGLYRSTLDGFSVVPCSIAPVLAGFFGGLIWLLNKRRFPTIIVAVSFAVLMEGLHMLLVLALARPFEEAVALVSSTALPIILANAAGLRMSPSCNCQEPTTLDIPSLTPKHAAMEWGLKKGKPCSIKSLEDGLTTSNLQT